MKQLGHGCILSTAATAQVFSESAQKGAIGPILSTLPMVNHGAKAHTEYNHAALNTLKRRGTPNKVDFALKVKDTEGSGEVYVETKWAGPSYCKGSEILKDLIRLENKKSRSERQVHF